MDLASEVVASLRPVDEPLQLVLKDPRRLRISLTDGLWIRLLDVASSLEARSYGADGSVVLEVLDTFGPWSGGRYRLQVRDAAGECRRSESPPDALVTIAGLSSAYLGGVSFSRLARGGSVTELKPGALELLDAMFVTEPKPCCPWVY